MGGRKKREERKKGVGLREFFLLSSFDRGEDPIHSGLGKAAKGLLQGLPGEIFVQKRPYLYPGFPAMDEIAARKVGLDPAAVIKSQHGPHLGAIDFQKVVLVNHHYLAKNPKTTFCPAGDPALGRTPPPFDVNSSG
jgi:hypothetical protein